MHKEFVSTPSLTSNVKPTETHSSQVQYGLYHLALRWIMNSWVTDRAGVNRFRDLDQFLITAILHETIDLLSETTKGYSDFP